MPNNRLEIVGEEFVTSIGLSNEFYVNLLFDRSIHRPMCTHMGKNGGKPQAPSEMHFRTLHAIGLRVGLKPQRVCQFSNVAKVTWVLPHP